MGRKVRSILLLIVVLLLIYRQHSPVIYAEEAAPVGKNVGASAGGKEETGAGSGNEEDAGAGSGSEKETGAGSGNEEDAGAGSGSEKDAGVGSGEGIEESGKETGNGGGEEEEEQKKGDTGTGEGTERDIEETDIYQKYELEYPPSDGKNGYYITSPEIRIRHTSERGSTHYVLHNGGEKMAEGRFTKAGEEIVLAEGQFREGANILSIYMEDSEGNHLEGQDCVREFWLDTQAPTVEMSAPEGFGVWYRDAVRISVSGRDAKNGSGILSVSCRCENEVIGTTERHEGEFLISRASSGGKGVGVTVTVTDKAGHKSEKTQKLYIDNKPPEMEINGAEDYRITSRPILATCNVSEENGLKEVEMAVSHESPDGIQKEIKGGWTDKEGKKACTLSLEEDGIYYMEMSATDMAGNVASKKMQMILDTQDPLIRHVDKLEGRYMRDFCWDYEKEAVIEDFTSYTYQIRLDGSLYAVGDKVSEEGRHVLSVDAMDSAGNKAQAKAVFVIDRTPPKILFLDVEEAGAYEEEKTFQIMSENPEDEVRGIRINGALQPLGQKKGVYQYTGQGSGEYEVLVNARDRAGNESISKLVFKIIPKETILEKTFRPIKKIFIKEAEANEEERKEEAHKASPLAPATAAVIVSVTGAVMVLAIRNCRKKGI